MSYSDLFAYKIAFVGPSGIGKTSLMTAIFMESQVFGEVNGVSYTLRPSTNETNVKINAARETFRRAVQSKRFVPIPGTAESSRFEVRCELRTEGGDEKFDIEFVDYRGGDLLKTQPEIERSDWYRQIMASKDLFVPIDSVAVMEYRKTGEKGILGLLSIDRVCEIVETWARHLDATTPYMVAFVPIKTETYMLEGSMDSLKQAVRELYYAPVKAALESRKNVCVQYNPVETYGCVILDEVKWQAPLLSQRFKITGVGDADGHVEPRISGAADLMIAIWRKRFAAQLAAFEKRITELNLKLDVKNKMLRFLIEHFPFLMRGSKRELVRMLERKSYYQNLIELTEASFKKSQTEIWKQCRETGSES